MIVLPAVDIRGGRAVRLRQGDFADETVYADDPLEAARAWVDQGARRLHVVDLDGARAGAPKSLPHLERMAAALKVPIQYGGGLRSLDAIASALDAGAERVVLGTAAVADPELVEEALRRWPGRIAAAVDAREGRVAVSGWLESTDATPEQVVEQLAARGVRGIVYTQVDRDGMLAGPDLEAVRAVAEVAAGALIYSGGIGSLDHLRALRELALPTLMGVVIGKALYEGRFSVSDAQAALGEQHRAGVAAPAEASGGENS
jgi:phosphoribosylformimino-5-aminoimidazole carboxamide ribotide isomerase